MERSTTMLICKLSKRILALGACACLGFGFIVPAIALGCEGASEKEEKESVLLKWKSPPAEPFKIVLAEPFFEIEAEYTGVVFNSGVLAVSMTEGFENIPIKGSCNGRNLEPGAGKTCVVRIKCTGAKEMGKVMVQSETRPLVGVTGKLKCE